MNHHTEVSTGAHAELDCADAEAMLREATDENADLRRELDQVRLDNNRLHALLDSVTDKNTSLATERDGLHEQVKLITEELVAAEADAVPAGTLMFAPLPRDLIVTQYRQASRINRGPLPPSVIGAVETARTQIVEAMAAAGNDAMEAVIRREVRRRRRNTNRPNRTTARAAARRSR